MILVVFAIVLLVGGYAIGNYFSITKIKILAHEVSMSVDPSQPESAEILELEYGSSIRQTRVARTDAVITSPKDGDTFCYGEWIPIRWSAPLGVDHANLTIETPSYYSPIGRVIGNRDDSGPVVRYSYDWDGTVGGYNSSYPKQFAPESNFYRISMELAFKDGSGGVFKSVGRFSIIDCHIDGVKPPVK